MVNSISSNLNTRCNLPLSGTHFIRNYKLRLTVEPKTLLSAWLLVSLDVQLSHSYVSVLLVPTLADLGQLFQRFVKQMLQEEALGVEDLIDLFSLQEAATDPYAAPVDVEEEDEQSQAMLLFWSYPAALGLLNLSQVGLVLAE